MFAIRVSARWACLLWLVVGWANASFAQELDGSKRDTPPAIGPPVPLSAEQTLAIQAKQAAYFGTHRPPAAPPRFEKPSAPPPNLALLPPAGSNLDRAPLAAKPIAWPTVSPSLGRVPRPSWSTPWFMKKPADVTISRPLRPSDGARRAPGVGGAGGSR